jgi:hypothetical protein
VATFQRLPAVLVRPYVVRAALLWVLARATLLVLETLFGGGGAGGALVWSPATALVIVPLCVVLGHVGSAMRGDQILLGNLGVDARQLSALFALVAFGAELALGVVIALAGR